MPSLASLLSPMGWVMQLLFAGLITVTGLIIAQRQITSAISISGLLSVQNTLSRQYWHLWACWYNDSLLCAGCKSLQKCLMTRENWLWIAHLPVEPWDVVRQGTLRREQMHWREQRWRSSIAWRERRRNVLCKGFGGLLRIHWSTAVRSSSSPHLWPWISTIVLRFLCKQILQPALQAWGSQKIWRQIMISAYGIYRKFEPREVWNKFHLSSCQNYVNN